MTIEEAIKHGKEQLEIFGGEHREFIKMAIKALEQEPRKGHYRNHMSHRKVRIRNDKRNGDKSNP